MELPQWCVELIRRLEENGFEAYAVGGCVRDMLLGKNPEDYDFAVSSLPEETKRVLEGFRVLDTGLKHGTVTVVTGGHTAEITTYRTESGYSDFRRPDRVSFTPVVERRSCPPGFYGKRYGLSSGKRFGGLLRRKRRIWKKEF